MKKILFISTNDHVPWGGSEKLWSQTAIYLKSKGYEVMASVWDWIPEPNPITGIKKKGVQLHKRNKTTIKKQNFSYLKAKIKGESLYYILNNQYDFLDFQPDLVIISIGDHIDFKIYQYATVLIEKKIPYILSVQLATDLRIISDETAEKLSFAYKNARKCFFLCQENIYKTELHLGTKLSNAELYNNPFKVNYKTIENPNDDGYYHLGMVASFTCFHKGQDLLLKVLSQEKWKSRNMVLNLYGKGINESVIKKLIHVFKLEEKVNLHGYINSKIAIWEANHACISVSRMEGSSLALLEALYCQRMVIGTKVGNIDNLIKHGETGFLIPAPTIEFIDLVLEEAWASRSKWLSMGLDAKRWLEEAIPKDPVEDFGDRIISFI